MATATHPPSIRVVVTRTESFVVPRLVFGTNHRDDGAHQELHLPTCRCAFHPVPTPHWHACTPDHADTLVGIYQQDSDDSHVWLMEGRTAR